MNAIAKLDWIPLYLDNIRGSSRWRLMKDFQRGWYISLLIEMAAAGGYLPKDGQLWKLAGAASRQFFEKEWALVEQCFEFREDDGCLWMYNRKLLTVLDQQLRKLQTKVNKGSRIKEIVVSISDSPVLSIYQDYPRKEGRKLALESIKKAIARYSSEHSIDPLAAAEFIHKAVIEFAKSPAGSRRAKDGGNLVPHPSTWFNQDRFLDDRAEWYRETFDADYEKRLAQASVGAHVEGREPVMDCWGCRKTIKQSEAFEVYCSLECKEEHEAMIEKKKAEAR